MFAALALSLSLTTADPDLKPVLTLVAAMNKIDVEYKKNLRTYGSGNTYVKKLAKQIGEKRAELAQLRAAQQAKADERKAADKRKAVYGDIPDKRIIQETWKVGEKGVFNDAFTVFQVIDARNVIIYRGQPTWLEMDTTGMVDGGTYSELGVIRYDGTKQYKTTFGTKTVHKFSVVK